MIYVRRDPYEGIPRDRWLFEELCRGPMRVSSLVQSNNTVEAVENIAQRVGVSAQGSCPWKRRVRFRGRMRIKIRQNGSREIVAQWSVTAYLSSKEKKRVVEGTW